MSLDGERGDETGTPRLLTDGSSNATENTVNVDKQTMAAVTNGRGGVFYVGPFVRKQDAVTWAKSFAEGADVVFHRLQEPAN